MPARTPKPSAGWPVKALTCALFAILLALAATPSALADGAGDELARQADSLIRDAERKMFGGTAAEADQLLGQAGAKLDELKAADPRHRKLSGLESKYGKLRQQVDKKLGAAAGTAPSSAKTTAPAPTGAGEKLPGGVAKRLKDIAKHLDGAERYAGSDAKQAAAKLAAAQELFDEIERSYGGQFDPAHPDFAAVQERYASLAGQTEGQKAAENQAQADAANAAAAQQQQSAEWVARFRPFLAYAGQEGHDPNQVVFVPGTSEPEKFAEAQRRYQAFKAFYATYQQTAFPHGKTWELEDLADRAAPERLLAFETEFATKLGSVAADADQQIAAALQQLDKDTRWKSDPSVSPPIIDRKQLATIEATVANAVAALGEAAPQAAEVRQRHAQLVAKDQEHRKLRAERTRLDPSVYVAGDKDELSKKAAEVVVAGRTGAKVLQVSLPKDAWEEKTEEGWTDTTRTTWQVKTFKKITAQVAAKDPTGVYLHTVYLARDKTSDGWGKLYGHIMWSDPMAEANVGR